MAGRAGGGAGEKAGAGLSSPRGGRIDVRGSTGQGLRIGVDDSGDAGYGKRADLNIADVGRVLQVNDVRLTMVSLRRDAIERGMMDVALAYGRSAIRISFEMLEFQEGRGPSPLILRGAELIKSLRSRGVQT